ncbi:MAG: hypothetical protein ABI478_03780 [Propionivibrio sp.]
MSEASFFAEMGVRIRDLCALNWTNVNLIADHGYSAVDRPRLAGEACGAIKTATGIFRDLGPERVPGAASELYRAGLIALSTIEPLLRWRYDESEAERPEELQTAQILIAIATDVVRANVLSHEQIREFEGLIEKYDRRAYHLLQDLSGADLDRCGLDKEERDDCVGEALYTCTLLDFLRRDIVEKHHKFRS